MSAPLIRFSIKHEFDALSATLLDFQRRELPFAVSLALNRAARDAQTDMRRHLAAAFERPRPWTLNSTFVQPATKRRLEAGIYFKDRLSKGVPAGRYLRPQILGGGRVAISTERRLAASGVVPPGYFIVPTKHADLDAFGGISNGQLAKIRSALRVNADVGVTSNASTERPSRGKRREEEYFAIVPGRAQRGGLPGGIYKVVPSAFGRIVVPVLLLLPRPPTYRQRLDFEGKALASFEAQMPDHMGRALEDALRSARPFA